MTAREKLEYACEQPGLWRIEGHLVERIKLREGRRRVTRWVIQFPDGRPSRYADTLRDAFEFIGEQVITR